MNPELLALIEILDAIKESPPTKPEEGLRLKASYESQLDKVLERSAGLSRETLEAVVERAYRRWLKSQSKPSSLPPKA